MYLISISGSTNATYCADVIKKLKVFLERHCSDFYVQIPSTGHYNNADEKMINRLENLYFKQIDEADLCIFVPKYIINKDDLENINIDFEVTDYIDTEKCNKLIENKKFETIRKFFGESTLKELYHCMDKEKEYIIYSFKNQSNYDVKNQEISKHFILELYHLLYREFNSIVADEFLKDII